MGLSAADLPEIYSLLVNSMSGDESLRKPSEAALSHFECKPGFCFCLLEVMTAKDLADQVDVRMMALVYLKNGIYRRWRNKQIPMSISSEEKQYVRQKLLSSLREENDKIAEMLAVLISKIVRFDYPKEWPDVFSVLANQLQSADIKTSHRIFLTMFRTMKELSSKRLTADKKMFEELSSQFFDFCWKLWQSDMQTILHGFSVLVQTCNENPPKLYHDDLYLVSERWLSCSKIMRQLIALGVPSFIQSVQNSHPVIVACPMMLNAIQSLLPFYSTFQCGFPSFCGFIKRACTKLMKILIIIQNRHAFTFGDQAVLPLALEFSLSKIIDPDPVLFSFEEFLIQCMIMVKHILECKEYRRSLTGRVVDENESTLEERKKNACDVFGSIITSRLPDERVILLCNVLIRRYFVLKKSDLEEWYHDSESFHHNQEMVQWTEKLRPCAEALYIVLFEKYSQLLGPVIVSILHEAMTNCPASVTEATPQLLLKDAAYGAASYVYYELSNYINFKDWFEGSLSLEISTNQQDIPIIHRKIALILGQWISEIKSDTRRSVYCGLIRLLQEKDPSVRLAACRSLCFHIEDASFSKSDFRDLFPMCCELCFKLVEDVHQFDSKVQVLNLISAVMGHINEVVSYAKIFLQFFQKSWEEFSGESLFQIQLLNALRNFVVAIDQYSPICYDMLLPILQKGLDVTNSDALDLLEDSLLLWEATLSHAPAMVPSLLGLFPYLMEIMERNFDNLEAAMNIIEDYVLLDGAKFLSIHISNVAKLVDFVIGNVSNKGLIATLPIIDMLIQCFPIEVPPAIGSALQKLVALSLNGGDNLDPSKTVVKASSGAILARILVMNTSYLLQLLAQPSLVSLLQQSSILVEDNSILFCLVDVWLDQVDNVSSTEKKIYALALSVALTLGHPQLLHKLGPILIVCSSVILGGGGGGGGGGCADAASNGDSDHSVSSINGGPGDATLSSKERRLRQIKASDPAHQIPLQSFVAEKVHTCAAFHGEHFNSAITKMHPSSLAQFKQAFNMYHLS